MHLGLQPRTAEKGVRTHPLYWIYRNMLVRCHNPRGKQYPDYGARGITVCDEWRRSFYQFVADVGARPSRSHQLDRIDNDCGYRPGNVRWVSPKLNSRNRRNTAFVEYEGERVPLSMLAERFDVAVDTLHRRLQRGWGLEKALTAAGARSYRS